MHSHTFIPVQPDPLSLPSPVKPVGQVQVKLPSTFIHVALMTQPGIKFSSLHSSTSETVNIISVVCLWVQHYSN